eukprot:TRINITY_DN11760_c0_g1_i1.p1 TRINITY_DN11760_c0_g1~~TRINITY_DN11760_c0_g1_i1.p1  ORF type:complete len:363 (+),score=38.80 TRINITY_DN11760_c0_g1_i1:401-1489(+)
MGDIRSTIGGWFDKIPFITRNVIITCSAIYIAQIFLGVSVGYVCNLPALILIRPSELWRLLTAGFFHMGLLHLALNMLSMQSLGAHLEHTMGSFRLGYLTLLFNALVSGLHFTISIIVSRYFDSPEYENQCSVGFSGVLFALLTVRCSSSDSQSQSSIFGLTSVPTRFYPWVLLLALQFLMPNISFIGHLSGILVGYLYTFGVIQPLIPSGRRISSWESSSLQGIVLCRGYVPYPDTGLSSPSNLNSRSWLSSLWSSAAPTLQPPSKQYEGQQAPGASFVGQGYVLGTTQNRPGENKPAESAAAAAVMRLHLMTQIPTPRTNSMPSMSTTIPSSASSSPSEQSSSNPSLTSKEPSQSTNTVI